MLSFPRPAKSPTITAPHRFLHRFRLKPFSTTAVPSQEHIARLILDQKSPNEALQTFKWASKIPNFLHSQSTFRALIHKLCLFRRFKTANQVLRQIPISIGCPPDEETFITIIRDFGRFRMAQQAIQVLDLIPQFDLKPSLKILNSALDVLVKIDIDLAKEFYRNRMMGSGIEPDSYTFGILMKGLCLTNRIAEGFKLLSLMKSRNLAPNSVIYNTLIHALCKNGKVGRGRSLMNEMDLPNDVTFNILISGYCSEGNLVQSMVLFDQCLSLGFVPDVVTVTKLIKVCCREGRVSDAVEVLQRVEERGIMVDSVAYNTVIKGYCDSGKVRVGTNLLKKMAAKGILPNLSTFNTLITGFCDNGELDLALDLFYEMKIDGVLPDFFTYDTLIRGLCVGGRIEDGLKILNLLEANRKGPEGQIGAYNSVIYGFYRDNRMGEAHKFLRQIGCFFPRAVDRSLTILHLCEEGEIGEAMGVYDRMVGEGGTPSTIIYASLIDGFCREGDLCRAFGLMNEMVAHKYLPSVSTFNSLISGFCREGKVGSAVKLMDEMIERGCLPDTGSYNPLIAACCRNGDFVKAFELLMLMVEKHVCPDPVTWNCLLLYLSKKMIGIENKNMIYVNGILNQILHIDRLTELDG